MSRDPSGAAGARPGRATRKDPRERTAEIRAAARELALEEGLAAVTLRSVAGRIGVAPGLVAHYAGSMDVLVAAAFTDTAAAELTEIADAVAARRDPIARMRALIATALAEHRRETTAVWVDAWSMGRRSAALAAAARAQMDAWQEFVLREITAGVEAGAFTNADPDTVAWQLIGMVDGLNAQSLVHYRDEAARGRLLARALELELGLEPGTLQN